MVAQSRKFAPYIRLRKSSVVFSLTPCVPKRQSAAESRRSTRVSVNVIIETQGITELLVCDGETRVVNLHGALISTDVTLRVGMEVEIHVILTDKRAAATVVYVDRNQPRHCGIGLKQPQNIWGISLPPMTGGKII